MLKFFFTYIALFYFLNNFFKNLIFMFFFHNFLNKFFLIKFLNKINWKMRFKIFKKPRHWYRKKILINNPFFKWLYYTEGNFSSKTELNIGNFSFLNTNKNHPKKRKKFACYFLLRLNPILFEKLFQSFKVFWSSLIWKKQFKNLFMFISQYFEQRTGNYRKHSNFNPL
jgi:hypothetical protein